MLPWGWVSLLVSLVLCCIFSRLVAVNGDWRAQKEGSAPCLWKEAPSILLGDPYPLWSSGCAAPSTVSGRLGGAVAWPGTEVSNPKQSPEQCLLPCTGSLQGQKPLNIWEGFVTLGGLKLSKPTERKGAVEGKLADVKMNVGRWRMW